MIDIHAASLGYGKQSVLDDVTCSISQGESVGLVGPNGSGKTTFLRGVLGILRPLKGAIEVDRSKRFAYVPQIDQTNLYWPLTVWETVLLALRAKRLLGRITSDERSWAEEAMAKTGIHILRDRLLRDASGGQRQKVLLAQALSQRPDVLLLDEPTRGLDVVAERDFLQLLERLRAKEGLTILLVTHTLQIPLNFSEQILLFSNGSVVVTDPEELVRTEKLREIYGVPFVHHEIGGMRWVAPAMGGT